MIPLLKNDLFKTQAALIASASGAGIQVILIMLSAQVSNIELHSAKKHEKLVRIIEKLWILCENHTKIR